MLKLWDITNLSTHVLSKFCIVKNVHQCLKIEFKLVNFIILKRWNNQRAILSFIKFNRTSSQSDEGENIRGSSISGWPSEVN